MNKIKDFHPKLIIVDHFEDIKSQIDVKTETLLQNKDFYESGHKILNELRQNQLNKIEQIKNENLLHVVFDEVAYKLKWNYLINDETLTFEQKMEIIKSVIIVKDCILIEDDKYAIGLSLWIIPWFCDQKHLEFLR